MDPIGFSGGSWSLYKYVENNPVNWVDPSGLIHSMCPDTRSGAGPGERSMPWKVIPDPKQPVTQLPNGVTQYCFIVVDQYCDPYCNPDAQIQEHVEATSHPDPPDFGGSSSWGRLGGHTSPYATTPRFCDPMHGRPGTANYQCYRVFIPNPTGEIIIEVLQPCPFTVKYGPNGPVRTSKEGLWGPNGIEKIRAQ